MAGRLTRHAGPTTTVTHKISQSGFSLSNPAVLGDGTMAKTATSEFLRGVNVQEINKALVGRKTEYGRSELPAGIENGVARLKEIKVGQFKEGKNKGQHFIMFTGVVRSPIEHDGVRCVNGTTQIGPEPMCDTPDALGKRKTQIDHFDWICNQVRLLLGEKEQTWGIEKLEEKLQTLNKVKPCFTFRTWKGQKQTTGQYAGKEPKVNHEWLGYVKYEEKVDQAALVTQAPSTNGTHADDKPAFDDGAEEAEFNYAIATLDDLDKLIDGCNAGDKAAKKRFEEIALEAGVTKEQYDDAEDYEEVRDLIEKATSLPEDDEDEDEEEEGDEEGDEDAKMSVSLGKLKIGKEVGYAPKGDRVYRCEILNLNGDKTVCTLKNTTTGKEYNGVKTDRLTS